MTVHGHGAKLPTFPVQYLNFTALLTLDLSKSSRIQMGALGHTLTPFCSVCRQFFGFIPGDVHVLQISSDDVHPIFPCASDDVLAN